MTSRVRRQIDLVIPVLNEAQNLAELYRRVSEVFAAKLPAYEWSAILVDDGSRDDSWAVIQKMTAAHGNLRAIRLNRNYGSHIAISAGLSFCDAAAAMVIAADLQDPPETIPGFVEAWEKGSQVVWGVRAERRESWLRRLYSRVFHFLVRRYALPGYPSSGTGSFCLIDRSIVMNLRRMRENFRTIFGLIAIQGYRSAEVPYVRVDRKHGKSGWSLQKMLRTTIDVFTSYSHLPVRAITWIGLGSCALAIVAILYQLWFYFFCGGTLRGWTMLFAAVCFFGGVQTFSLGVLGEYLWRTFHEVKQRPLWFIETSTFPIEERA